MFPHQENFNVPLGRTLEIKYDTRKFCKNLADGIPASLGQAVYKKKKKKARAKLLKHWKNVAKKK